MYYEILSRVNKRNSNKIGEVVREYLLYKYAQFVFVSETSMELQTHLAAYNYLNRSNVTPHLSLPCTNSSSMDVRSQR